MKAVVPTDVIAKIKALPGSQHYFDVMLECIVTHSNKCQDYSAAGTHPLSSFTEIARLAGVTPKVVFAVTKAIKQSRRAALAGRAALHESTRDTIMDEINYLALELAYQTEFPALYNVVPT